MKKINRKILVSLGILIFSFIIIRYILFDIHGMKQFPMILFLCVFLAITVSTLTKLKITPYIFAIAYPIGFIIGLIFQKNRTDLGGGLTNNLWLIWVSSIVIIAIISIIIEFIIKKNSVS
ncbi:hypothetical protein [Helcococcus massiliensis]|uniref:hypothetical protein n=1 Tax=Helcococcus massiliensis TaxID=2040290 RepID=UPI000CDE769A|nr:hypothetical protein [Helcococcus massiliensis]